MRALTSSEFIQVHGGVKIDPLALLKENVLKPAACGAITAMGIGFALGQKKLGRLAVIYSIRAVASYNFYCIGTLLFPN